MPGSESHSISVEVSRVNGQLNSTLVHLKDLVPTEGIDPVRVQDLWDKVSVAGGLLSPIQVIRLADGRYAIVDGHNRDRVLHLFESNVAWVQIHEISELQLGTWLTMSLADIENCLIPELLEVDQETFERLADTRGGLVAMGADKKRFFTFPIARNLKERLGLQHRVVASMVAANRGERLKRREDDIRTGGSGWWRVLKADGQTALVFPLLSVPEFIEVVRLGLTIPAGASRFLIPKLRIVDDPIPVGFMSRPLTPEMYADLDQLLAKRETTVDYPSHQIDEEEIDEEEDSDPITPLLPLPEELANTLDLPANVRLFVKDETTIGSSKARVARSMLVNAAAAGNIEPGTEVVLPSSGSTAIAFAEETRKRNLNLTVFVPENIAAGKLRTLQQNRHVAVIRVQGSSEDARCAAEQYVAANQATRPIWFADQYADPAAARAHAMTTAPEILIQTGGHVTHVVVGMGTGATSKGFATVLPRLGVHVIGVQPSSAKHALAGLKHLPSLPPNLVPKNARPDLLSSVEFITDDEGLAFTRLLNRHGLRFGPSTGAVLAAVTRVVACLEGEPATIVLIGHDSADLYEAEHEVVQ